MTDESKSEESADVKTKPNHKNSGTKRRRKKKSRVGISSEAAKGKGARAPWTFPKNTLEDALRVAKAVEEKNAGNPMPASILAKATGFKQSLDWRFLDLLRSANQYGLVEGSGANAIVSMAKLGQDIVVPASPQDRQKALLAAFNKVPDFKSVADFYGGKRIPEDEFFLNTLSRQFKIPRDRANIFAEVFVTNLKFLKAFDVKAAPVDEVATESSASDSSPTTRVVSKEPRVREYLDTCFMMMPFGGWFDKYYQEIYVPAIKDAGFEPVRADELFNTGSVVEQIWEQIEKAKVLLADLTDKNANVFYELGLAHAARKPVVFTAGKVEDVPFDLRHLRVIIYETREPDWAITLKRSVTDFLKNALKDPSKSIPHPFRKQSEDEEAQQ